MTQEPNGGTTWGRVAAELRACREAQQRAWGDIDNTTLGRYLAGEVSPDERQHIEAALQELPELRKLLELVRDVLGEPEVADTPASVPYGPAVLPFSQPSVRAAAGRTLASRGAPPSAGPSRGWNVRPAPRYRQRVGLVAAAGLLLALGVALPRSVGTTPTPTEPSLAFAQPTAARSDFFLRQADRDDREAAPLVMLNVAGGNVAEHEDALLARIDASVRALEVEGKKAEAETLARQYASNLTRQALCFQDNGDLARAEPTLEKAQRLCTRALGPQAPETVRTRHSLAGVYEAALNAAPVVGSTYLHLATHGQASPYGAASDAASQVANGAAYIPARGTFRAPATARLYADQAPQRSSSSYGPPMAVPAPSAAAVQSARLDRRRKQLDVMLHERAQTEATVALRDRLTSQSQHELRASVVPVLAQALREARDAAECQRLALALGQLGPAAHQAVPILLDRYHKASATGERATILLSLGEIGPEARSALPVLVEALRSAPLEVRRSAAGALVQLGPTARPAVEKLLRERPDDALLRDVLARLDGPEGHSGIHDPSECFSVKAIQEARQDIQQLAATFHLEIGVETTPHRFGLVARADVPAPPVEAKRPVRKLGEHGIRLHIDRDAGEARIHVAAALQKRGLTEARLRQVMEPHLRNKDYDRGLREAIRFVARFEREHGAGE